MSALVVGKRLGPYEIVSPIGAGGMGEVFKARDTRLDRSVAIKVLPSAFAANAQLRVRFEREAKTISQFSHPHICTLYDVGQQDGVAYLVMEYLEGESLASRLARGPLPLDQVIRYGVQICEALERAHRHGIVHRDLKPGNVMLTPTGAKLLDFGLAKEAERMNAAAAMTEVRADERKSITEQGTIVGTFQYMAPEQLEGADVDARTDIFALGAVLYEMTTGRRAFDGRTKASLIASILATEPQPVSAVQPSSPLALDRVIRTCLQKNPEERFQSAHDVKLALSWTSDGSAISNGSPAAAVARTRRSRVAALTAIVLAIALAGTAAVLVRDRLARRNATPVRTTITAPQGAEFSFVGSAGPPEISPDGTKIVFSAGTREDRVLWLRSLDGTAPQPIRGTARAIFPFWSPDSRSIAFFQDGELKKVKLDGGPATRICDAPQGRGGTWSPDGRTILFANRYSPIYRVPASGGIPVAVTANREHGDVTHRWPRFLPDGTHFLYLASPVGTEDPRNQICVGSLETKLRKPLVTANSQPLWYDGRVLYTREGNLIAQRFDLSSLELTGDPVVVPEPPIRADVTYSRAIVSLAANGTLVYQTGAYVVDSELLWLDRAGRNLGQAADRQPYGTVALDPAARTAIAALRGSEPNLWSIDLARGVRTRLTFNRRDQSPVWSADGKKIAYASISAPPPAIDLELWAMDAATRQAQRVLEPEGGDDVPTSWSPDGRLLFYMSTGRAGRSTDIHYVSVDDGKRHVYLATPAEEVLARMSPDGRFVAYQSLEGARWQIFVAPFPATGAKWQVSTDGGVVPRWRADGKELFYIANGRTMIAVPIALGDTPEIGKPAPLFTFRPALGPVAWDVTADGERFLINGHSDEEPQQEALTLVQNFGTALRAAEQRQD